MSGLKAYYETLINMRRKTKFLFFAIVIGLFFAFLNSCDEEEDNNVPVLKTTNVTEISQTTAISRGNHTDDAKALTARELVFILCENICY